MPRVNIWIPDAELKVIDTFCKAEQISRSEVMRKATLHIIQQKQKQNSKCPHFIAIGGVCIPCGGLAKL